MKKIVIIFAVVFAAMPVFSQDLTSKKGEPILPEAKDWGLGIDASPFLNYIGNFFGKSANNTSPAFNFLSNAQTISGKYFKTATTAYRASVRIGVNTNTARNMVTDRSAPTGTVVFPIAVAMKQNSWKHSVSAVGLSAGIEKRRGKTRLQGIYGAEAGFYVIATKDKFTYGNALSTGTASAVDVTKDDAMSSAALGNANNLDTVPAATIQGATGIARITERKNGATFSFGIRAFIGAEYFMLPKMSIGGEFGWGIGAMVQGKPTTTYESKGTSTSGSTIVAPTTVQGSKNGSFKLDTDNINSMWGPTATIRLNLYF